MPRAKPIEMITPPNTLKVKVGGKLPMVDQEAIKRAEAALEALSDQFDDWMGEELSKLDDTMAAAKAAGYDAPSLDEVFRRAHDIKGLGTTYEYPLVSRIADSLCRLIEEDERRTPDQAPLVIAHVNAIKAAVRDGVKTVDHPVGLALATELETQVNAVLG